MSTCCEKDARQEWPFSVICAERFRTADITKMPVEKLINKGGVMRRFGGIYDEFVRDAGKRVAWGAGS
jgi:hypothetical protein